MSAAKCRRKPKVTYEVDVFLPGERVWERSMTFCSLLAARACAEAISSGAYMTRVVRVTRSVVK